MPFYRVEVPTIGFDVYIVEADNEDEARLDYAELGDCVQSETSVDDDVEIVVTEEDE